MNSTSMSKEKRLTNRWWQLAGCILMMMAIANLQYAWTLFTIPLTKALGVKLSAVQIAFTLFILLETWLVPFEGWLIDNFGARLVVTVGGLMVGLSWIGSGMVASLGGCISGTALGVSAPGRFMALAWDRL
jgi:OFA family oxalate/formate antiporter-like MFS transporter